MRTATCLLLIVLTAPALLAQSTVEDRLSRIENEMTALRAENEALRKQLAAVATPTPPPPAPPVPVAKPAEPPKAAAKTQDVKPAGKEPRLQIGGLVQVQGESGGRPDIRFTDDNDRVFLRRVRINATGKFDESVDFKVEYDATNSLAASSGMRAQLIDGYATWTKSPQLFVRMGQFKTPYGFEQLSSDQTLPAPERTLGNDRIVPSRQLGLMLGGATPNKRLSYSAGAYNGTGTNSTANDDDGFLVAGRLAGLLMKSAHSSLNVGVNAFRTEDTNVGLGSEYGFDSTPATSARDNIFAGTRTGLGADAQLTLGKVELWAEMLRAEYEPKSALPRRSFNATAWYVQGTVPLLGDKLQGVVRYDIFDPNGDISGNDTKSWLVGTNYFIKGHDLKLQLHYLNADWAGHRDGRVIARFQTIF